MKKALGLMMVLMLAISCSAIENATEKYKTPEAPNAGLAEGEKSNYLKGDDSVTEKKVEEKKPAVKKKVKKKTK